MRESPGEYQFDLYRRFADDEKMHQGLVRLVVSDQFFSKFDCRDENLRRLISENLIGGMDAVQKVALVNVLSRSEPGDLPTLSWRNDDIKFPPREEEPLSTNDPLKHFRKSKDRIEGVIKFLDELEPQLDSPDLKEKIGRTRQRFQGLLKRLEE